MWLSSPSVHFFESLWEEASRSFTPWVLLLAAVSFLLAKWVALDKPRFKAMFFFIAAHLIGLVATAGFDSVGSNMVDLVRTPTWVLAAAGLVGAGATLLFSVVLPRMRLHAPLIVQDVVVAIAMVGAMLGVLSRAGVNLSG